MAEIRWTEQAADDLESIAEFIANDSPHYASLFCISVLSAIDRLERFPQLGRVVPETSDPQIRELILGSYRLIYRFRGEAVEMLSIYHSARILDPARIALPE